MPTTTVHRSCLYCGAEQPVQVPAAAWHNWTIEAVPADRAFRGIDADTRRWLTQQMCPACYRAAVVAAPADYYWQGTCAGCGQTESFGVSELAMTAHRTGQLSDLEAFPHHSDDQRSLIDMGCHLDCYTTAVHRPRSAEPSHHATH